MLNKRFISFEGGEGSGKSTQIKILKNRLSKIANVIVTREPGGTMEGEQIRKILVKGDLNKFSGQSETLLNFAARIEHVNKIIIPNLKNNKWVLCDRFIDSTTAYQGYGRRINIKMIENLSKNLINNIKPNITFLLDIDPLEGIKRSRKRFNKELRYENMSLAYHRRIRSAFKKIAKNNKKRIIMIDANLNKTAIAEYIWKFIQKKISL